MEIQNKRLIICCNGRWDNLKMPSNVDKFIQNLKPVSSKGIPQLIFHDQNINIDGTFNNSLGQRLGLGIKENVLNIYRFLAENYQKDDEIYLLGFSRGAYVARTVSGLLHTVGLLPRNELNSLAAAFKYFRTPIHNRNPHSFSRYHRPEIKMMAVWDTVGLIEQHIGFHDSHLSPEVKNAFHALAVDEKRPHFKPSLWTGKINSDQNVEQVWFAGVHGDVGGGYLDSGLSDITLDWIISKASALGLQFENNNTNHESVLINPNIFGKLHDTYSLPYRLMNKLGIKNGLRSIEGDFNNPPVNISIDRTVGERIDQVEQYKPKNVFEPTAAIMKEDTDKATAKERRSNTRLKTKKLSGDIQMIIGSKNHSSSCDILDVAPSSGVKIKCDLELDKSDAITISSPEFEPMTASCAWRKGNVYGLKFVA